MARPGVKYFQHMSAGDAALLGAGLATFCVAAFVLWGGRRGARRGEKKGPRFTFPGVGRVSEPTRVVAGYLGLILAYHLVVWAFPPDLTPIQLPRQRWWIVLIAGSAAVAASLGVDRLEQGKPDGTGPEEAPEDAGSQQDENSLS